MQLQAQVVSYLISEHKDKFADVLDHNGLNIVSYSIEKYSWDCLTELVNILGLEVLNVADESTGYKPIEYAKVIGYEKPYSEWYESLSSGHKYEWSSTQHIESNQTLIMFNGTLLPSSD